ncbi:MAG: glycosyltransferase family 39 protein [Planctomycetota bacterium]
MSQQKPPLQHSLLLTLYSVLLAFLICAALWPATRWVEFSTGSEQLVVAAALESQREGTWERRLVPTMAGEPRLRKPPLTTWLAMAVVSTDEARQLASGSIDDAAFAWAAMKIRGVALLLGALTLVLTFELGRVLVDREAGWLALAVCGSTFFFAEQFSRLTTDVVLATTVVGANVALAHAVLRGRRWGIVVCGLMLGFSFLAKGPVGLLMTLGPLAVLWLVMKVAAGLRPAVRLRPAGSQLPVSVAVFGSLLVFLLIAVPWFVYVLRAEPGAWSVWTQEVARTDQTVPSSDPWAYLIFPLLTGPWAIFTLLGLVGGLLLVRRRLPRLMRTARRHRVGLLWATLMVVVPIVVMTLFRDRKDRYLLPLIPPAALLAGVAIRTIAANVVRHPKLGHIIFGLNWLVLLAFAVGMPVATMVLPRNEYDDPSSWLPVWLGISLAVVGLVCWLLWFRLGGGHKWLIPARVVTATVFLFLFATNVFLAGYANSREAKADLKPIAEVIRTQTPDADVWHGETFVPPGLLIYSGRIVRPEPSSFDPASQHVFVKRQRRAETDPPPTMPEPWRVLTTARRDRSIWWAFVKEPTSP